MRIEKETVKSGNEGREKEQKSKDDGEEQNDRQNIQRGEKREGEFKGRKIKRHFSFSFIKQGAEYMHIYKNPSPLGLWLIYRPCIDAEQTADVTSSRKH